jgi:ABC-type dipeptide/oligopeptide/nickel transport system permease subunit
MTEDGEATSPAAGVAAAILRHPSALSGVCILIVLIGVMIVGPWISPYDPTKQNLNEALDGISAAHWQGTDQLGRDELTRLIYGAQYSLAVGLFAVAIGALIGVPIGAVSGYFGGVTDLLVQRVTDVLLSFPGILLALALVAGFGPGLVNVIVAVGISSVPIFIRLVRASVLSIRQLPYVESARALGQGDALIILQQIMPNALAPVIVQASLQLGSAILVAAGLGFLGLGVPPPTPEWGQMLGEGRNYVFSHPRLSTIPGVAICLAVLAFNLLGDGLRDVLDPRQKA